MGSPLINTTVGEGVILHSIHPICAPQVKRMRMEKEGAVEEGVALSCTVEEGVDVRRRASDAIDLGPLTALSAFPALRVCEAELLPLQLDGEWSEDESHGSRDSDSRDSREESGSGGDSRDSQDVDVWSMAVGASGAPDSPSAALLLKRGYAALLHKLQTRKAVKSSRATAITV